jgi:hypothetical protein
VNGKEEDEEEDRGQLVAWQGELQALQDEYDKVRSNFAIVYAIKQIAERH